MLGSTEGTEDLNWDGAGGGGQLAAAIYTPFQGS